MTIQTITPSFFNSAFFEILSHSVYQPTEEKLQHRMATYLANPNIKMVGYFNDDTLLALLIFETLEANTFVIKDFSVAHSHQRHGIGSLLMSTLVTKFNATSIIAETDDDAVMFYKKYGFDVNQLPQTNRYYCVYQ